MLRRPIAKAAPLVVAVGAALALGAAGCGGAPRAPADLPIVKTSGRIEGREVRWRGGTFRLVSVEIVGNEHVPSPELLAALLVARARELDEETLRYDEMLVAAKYWDLGYMMVQVEPIVLLREEFGDELRARIVVREGPRITVRSVQAREETPGGPAPLSVTWFRPMFEGEPFSRTRFTAALDELRLRYRDRGQAEVDVDLVEAIDVRARTVAIDLTVKPGRYFWFGPIRVLGNRALTGDAIREELAVREGDLYSQSALMLARDRLRALGWFTRVVVATVPGPREGTMEVHFEVDEGPGLASRTAIR